ncbi:protein ECT2 isoform X2 [Fopius arisanus]|uniref:Protein ECT2 isoform X2 n=1 Tax=Fopius arisanus TaxID=64838 RepID=A0A9R1T7V7_9HYME|nr:PREDICTED: protein ECT2-like isoform X2 [Fopius arisanus]
MEEQSVHSSISDINSEEPAKTEPGVVVPRKKRICLVGAASSDPALGTAAQQFGVPVLKSVTGIEYVEDTTYCTYFILREFEGPEYETLHKSAHRILGPTALLQLADKKESLPSINRPMYTRAMLGTVVVFTGFRKKDELTRLINMIHCMGGSIRKEVGAKVTHLIANCCGGEKYRYAVTFRVPIMSMNWVLALWEGKDDATSYGSNEDLIVQHKLKPFYGARVCFFGFPDDEKKHMVEVLQQQGGEPTEIDDPECTHVVTDLGNNSYKIADTSNVNSRICFDHPYYLFAPLYTEKPWAPGVKIPEKSLTDDTGISTSQDSLVSTSDSISNDSLKNQSQDSAICMEFTSKESNDSVTSTSSSQISPDGVKLFREVSGCHELNYSKRHVPRRRFRWRRSRSCFILPPIETSNQSRFVKIYSHPNLSKNNYDEELMDSRKFRGMRKSKSQGQQGQQGQQGRRIFDVNFPFGCKREIKTGGFRRIETSQDASTFSTSSSGAFPGFKVPQVPVKFPKNRRTRGRDTTGQREKRCLKKFDVDYSTVVDESNVNSLPDLASVRAHIVKAEWFWTSVQNEGAADEKEYRFEDYLESVMSPSASSRRESQSAATPTTASTRRKRKRLAETLSSLVQNGADSPAVHKRRSSISDAGHLSVSGSFLDCTASPDKQMLDEVEAVTTDSARKNLSPRHQVVLELVQTESNYVGILSTIMTLFKSPLEDYIETSNELLNSTEAKIIFGNFPPIYDVHKKMLEELRYCAAHWTEDTSIGNIFLKYAPDLVDTYPPYVNFFENTKEMLEQCDQNKPRFHAFLKICQTKPECGRQSLKELMIKPVQRLPSISLLLTDILKHTNKNNPDHSALELAISSIKEVMTHINEDKRKTEGQLVMFDIFNEIDNCPPHLVSSHRSFIGKCDVMELGEGLSGRGDHLVLFLFTDTMEICKKRSKAFNSLKSPNMANGLHTAKLSQGKPYKHIKMLSLSTIKKVVDIRETDECQKVFALMVRSNQELKEKLFSFTITDEEVNKTNYLKTLCRQMANTVCKADADTFLISLDSHQLEIDTSDVALGTLSKAFKSLFHNFYLEYMDPFATRTKMKVGRAFSFNKTPSKLKRAMSTMMSPFGSTHSLTPASQQLAQMRLASCNNINELGNGGSDSSSRDEVLVAPMSVQPTRKAKCSSLSIASLRRNCSEEVIEDKSNI